MNFYQNLEELEMDLKILKLKNDILEEKVKLETNKIKESFKAKVIAKDLLLGGLKLFVSRKLRGRRR